MKLEDYIASIENYPKEGVTFRDISPLMADGNAYSYAIREIVQYATDKKIDNPVGTVGVTVKKTAKEIKIVRTLKLKKQLITPAEYPAYYRLMSEWLDTGESVLLF